VPSVFLIRPTSGAVRCLFDWMVSMWNSRRDPRSAGGEPGTGSARLDDLRDRLAGSQEQFSSSSSKAASSGPLLEGMSGSGSAGGSRMGSSFEALHYHEVMPTCATVLRAGIHSVSTGAFQCAGAPHQET
jgi:hypothetical protein